jgi:Na+-driven multidrug efflux pump
MKDLTQGSVLSHALTMAVPIFAGLVLVLLCGLIDLYFVGGLGEAAVAGIGAAGPGPDALDGKQLQRGIRSQKLEY